MRSVLNRAVKTFIEVFVCALIPTITAMMQNPTEFNFANWRVYAIQIGLPALGTAISAAWNSIENYIKSKEAEDKAE